MPHPALLASRARLVSVGAVVPSGQVGRCGLPEALALPQPPAPSSPPWPVSSPGLTGPPLHPSSVSPTPAPGSVFSLSCILEGPKAEWRSR